MRSLFPHERYSSRSLFEHIGHRARAISPKAYVVGGVCLVLFLMVYGFLFAAPIQFPTREVVVVSKGETLAEISQSLFEDKVIRSPLVFRALVMVSGNAANVQAGAYQFKESRTVFGVIFGLLGDRYRVTPVRVTFPEGVTVREMALILSDAVPGFHTERFLELATPHEGFLFPDTYLITPGSTPDEVVLLLRETFDQRVDEIAPELRRFGKPLTEVVIMASLLEKEARTHEVRRMIAGILWNRLAIDMPLQVDAVFGYIQGTKTFHPSYSDLEVDSPYNTYKYKGLPPGPIGNPGLEALRAAATPFETSYLFYLSDAAGNIHYSKDFAGHVRNRVLYQ